MGFQEPPFRVLFRRETRNSKRKAQRRSAVGCDSQVGFLIGNRTDHVEGIIFCVLSSPVFGASQVSLDSSMISPESSPVCLLTRHRLNTYWESGLRPAAA